MIEDRVIFALAVRGVLLTVAMVNLLLAFDEYVDKQDARGLRGFVAGIGFLCGVLAIAGAGRAIQEEWPTLEAPMRWLSIVGTTGFLIALVFSVVTWIVGRQMRRRRAR